jgi:CRP-like cAMP-binding protein
VARLSCQSSRDVGLVMEVTYLLEEIEELKKAVKVPKALIECIPPVEKAIDLEKIDIKALSRSGTVKRMQQHETLFEIGDTGDELFLILRGRVEVLCGDGSLIAVLGTGELFGEMSILEKMPRSATVKVLEELTALMIHSDNFEAAITNLPSVALRIMQALSGRVRKLNHQVLLAKSKAPQFDEDVIDELMELKKKLWALEGIAGQGLHSGIHV